MRRGQTININMSLGEVDSNPQISSNFEGGVHDFSGRNNCRCDAKSRRTRVRSETQKCY